MQNQIEYYHAKLNYEMDPSDLFHQLNDNQKLISLDTRQPHGYETEHIPEAINIPHQAMTKETTSHLDKTYIYVCYCDGIGCNASTKGALKMIQLGFKVKELIGGIQWWKFDGYKTEGTSPSEGHEIVCTC